MAPPDFGRSVSTISTRGGGQILPTTLKFIFPKKVPKMDEIFTVDLTLCSRRQIDREDFVNCCGLLRKHELYYSAPPDF